MIYAKDTSPLQYSDMFMMTYSITLASVDVLSEAMLPLFRMQVHDEKSTCNFVNSRGSSSTQNVHWQMKKALLGLKHLAFLNKSSNVFYAQNSLSLAPRAFHRFMLIALLCLVSPVKRFLGFLVLVLIDVFRF